MIKKKMNGSEKALLILSISFLLIYAYSFFRIIILSEIDYGNVFIGLSTLILGLFCLRGVFK